MGLNPYTRLYLQAGHWVEPLHKVADTPKLDTKCASRSIITTVIVICGIVAYSSKALDLRAAISRSWV